jgi:toxin ParE1/3/4
MKYTLSIRKEAEQDIKAARDYYESCRNGLGAEYLLCVEAALSRIQRNPLSYRRIHSEFRRLMLHRFPYAVYFLVKGARVVVIAVMHIRREPLRWQSRN